MLSDTTRNTITISLKAMRSANPHTKAAIDAALAELAALPAQGEAWEPVNVVDDAIDVDGFGPILVSIDANRITMRQEGMGGVFLEWSLKGDLRICRRVDAPTPPAVPQEKGESDE